MINFSSPRGWECIKCGRVNSPYVSFCPCLIQTSTNVTSNQNIEEVLGVLERQIKKLEEVCKRINPQEVGESAGEK